MPTQRPPLCVRYAKLAAVTTEMVAPEDKLRTYGVSSCVAGSLARKIF